MGYYHSNSMIANWQSSDETAHEYCDENCMGGCMITKEDWAIRVEEAQAANNKEAAEYAVKEWRTA